MSIDESRTSGSPAGVSHRPKTFAAAAVVGAVVVLAGATLWSQMGNDDPAVEQGGAASAPTLSAKTAGVAGPKHQATQPTTFIVTDAETATTMRAAIEDSDRIRATNGLSPYGDVVILASSDADGEMLERMILEFNPLHFANGVAERRVVRLVAEALPGAANAEESR